MSVYVTSYGNRKRKARRHTARLAKRSMLLVLPLFLLLSAVFIFLQAAAANSSPQEVYVVQSGDSLWSIAIAHAPAQMDVRVYVQQLRQLNELRQSMIHVGEVLVLPAGR